MKNIRYLSIGSWLLFLALFSPITEAAFHSGPSFPRALEKWGVFVERQKGIPSQTTKSYREVKLAAIYHLKGTIAGKYAITMELKQDENRLTGRYRYVSQGKDIYLKGRRFSDGRFEMEEFITGEGGRSKTTGHFKGGISQGAFKGAWRNAMGTKTFPFILKPYYSGKLYDWVFESDYHINRVTKIRISDRKRGSIIQVLDSFEANPSDNRLIIEDMNFDGYKDLRIIAFIPASANIPYIYWLFDPDSGKFKRERHLEEILAPKFDYKNKLITSHVRAGMGMYFDSTYRYIKGRPTLVREEKIVYDKGKGVKRITVSELKDGRMVVTREYTEAMSK